MAQHDSLENLFRMVNQDDGEEISEAVRDLLFKKPPFPLVSLVGRSTYNEGVQDLFEMLQSPIFMRQLGYGVLEILVLHLCPEMKELFQDLDQRS